MACGLREQGVLLICCGFKQNMVSLSANLLGIFRCWSLQADLGMTVLQGLSWQESIKLLDFPYQQEKLATRRRSTSKNFHFSFTNHMFLCCPVSLL